jgi:hypothetical protein
MQGGAVRAFARVLAIGVAAFSLSGCVTGGERTSASSGALPGGATTVAFESIDGPPPAVFQTLVEKLGQEAEARQVPMVTREGYAPYRVRGYVAASVVKKQAVVSWVWDVYDAEARRVTRLGGEDSAAPAARDAWQAAGNEAVLAKLARSGMEQLAAYLNASGPAEPGPAMPASEPDGPEGRQAIQVAADDFAPEAQGIHRIPAAAQAETPAAPQRAQGSRARVAAAAPL